ELHEEARDLFLRARVAQGLAEQACGDAARGELHAGGKTEERGVGGVAIEAGLGRGALEVPAVEALLDALEAEGGEGALEDRAQGSAVGELDAQLVAEGLEEDLARLDLLLAEQARAVERALGEHALAEGVDGGDGGA